MPRVACWGSQLEAAIPDVAFRQGVSVAEVAKYELLFNSAAAVQRWQALA